MRTCIHKVGDINAAKEWYARIFETESYFNEPYYVKFDIGGYELGLQPEEGSGKDKAASVVLLGD